MPWVVACGAIAGAVVGGLGRFVGGGRDGEKQTRRSVARMRASPAVASRKRSQSSRNALVFDKERLPRASWCPSMLPLGSPRLVVACVFHVLWLRRSRWQARFWRQLCTSALAAHGVVSRTSSRRCFSPSRVGSVFLGPCGAKGQGRTPPRERTGLPDGKERRAGPLGGCRLSPLFRGTVSGSSRREGCCASRPKTTRPRLSHMRETKFQGRGGYAHDGILVGLGHDSGRAFRASASYAPPAE